MSSRALCIMGYSSLLVNADISYQITEDNHFVLQVYVGQRGSFTMIYPWLKLKNLKRMRNMYRECVLQHYRNSQWRSSNQLLQLLLILIRISDRTPLWLRIWQPSEDAYRSALRSTSCERSDYILLTASKRPLSCIFKHNTAVISASRG